MMTLANYGIKSARQKDSNSAKVLSKSLQIRNRAELSLKQSFKTHYRVNSDRRSEIFKLIVDYYSRIHFDALIWNKYEVKQCICDSIFSPRNQFNPYKARDAFKMVENMLINLVYLPWHTEFRKIHLYSGDYRLSIDKAVMGMEQILRAAGFQEDPGDPLHLILSDRMMPQIDDGESVTSVIFDLMLAQIVCSDVIDVYEKCFKAVNISIAGDNARMTTDGMLNCYPWMPDYFRERTCQTTERACESIEKVLIHLTLNISKSLVDLMRPNQDNKQSSDVIGAREKTKESLGQQVKDSDNLVTSLPIDLLRLPNYSVSKNTIGNLDIQDSSSASFKIGNSIEQSNINGYNMDRYNTGEPHKAMTKSSSVAPYSGTNHHHHLIEIDNPHNDRELLLPKYADKRHHQQSIRREPGHPAKSDSFGNEAIFMKTHRN